MLRYRVLNSFNAFVKKGKDQNFGDTEIETIKIRFFYGS